MSVKHRRGFSLLESTIKIALFGAGLALSFPIGQASHAFILSRFGAEVDLLGWFPHLAAIGGGLVMGVLALWLPLVGVAAALLGGTFCAGLWRHFRQALSDFRGCWRERA